MPFKSEAQRKMMWARHPAIARRWAHKYGNTARPNVSPARKLGVGELGTGTVAGPKTGRKNFQPVKKETPQQRNFQPVKKEEPQKREFQPVQKSRPIVTPVTHVTEKRQPEPEIRRQPGKVISRTGGGNQDERRKQLTDALMRMRARKAKANANEGGLDRVQKMQRQGLMIKNVGRPDYQGPINTRRQNYIENSRKSK